MAQDNKSVTLTKGGHQITTSLAREVVQLKAAGWRVADKPAAGPVRPVQVPVADSAQDDPISTDGPAADGAGPRPAAAKGGSKK